MVQFIIQTYCRFIDVRKNALHVDKFYDYSITSFETTTIMTTTTNIALIQGTIEILYYHLQNPANCSHSHFNMISSCCLLMFGEQLLFGWEIIKIVFVEMNEKNVFVEMIEMTSSVLPFEVLK